MTAAEALATTEAALADERRRVLTVADAFHGTIPPPPWPKHAELVAAEDKVRILRDGLRTIADRKPTATVTPQVTDAVDRSVAQLNGELDVLDARFSRARRNLPDLLAGGGLFLAVAVLLFLDDRL